MVELLWRKVKSPRSRIGLSFIGGTLVAALYLMIVYPLTSLACQWGWFAAPLDNLGLKIIQLISTVIAIALVAGCGALAFCEWQRAQTEGNHEAGETHAARNPLLAFVTMNLNGLYLLIMLVSLAPIFVLPGCAQ
jgi:hypothetical protein